MTISLKEVKNVKKKGKVTTNNTSVNNIETPGTVKYIRRELQLLVVKHSCRSKDELKE
eukprot:Pgem_evm1s17582